ncbi:MAG: hypothetical protein RR595_05140 [Lysinibacillus sp.]
MNQMNTYNLCCKYHGKRVRITDNQGRVHVGEISKVDRNMVYIHRDNDFCGYGLGFFGFGRAGFGLGFGIALGAITAIALVSAIFW